jgi:hypothetical protein
MAFIKTVPRFAKEIENLETSNEIQNQLWQQMVLIRHLGQGDGIYGKKIISPWIDQAKIYFNDAYRSNWRSSGLLYYYSFLNLAKAYLVAKRLLSAKQMKSINIYHGLKANPQAVKSILDYEIMIYPPIENGKYNIFSSFYEKTTGQKWPFRKSVSVGVKDIIAYCNAISSESYSFYKIEPKRIICQSLLRDSNNEVWFEICIHKASESDFLSQFTKSEYVSIKGKDLNYFDRNEWFSSYNKTNTVINNCCFFRSKKYQVTEQTRQSVYTKCMIENNGILKPFARAFTT